MEKKKIAKNILNQNKNTKYNIGDSYEFNFTFNNFNSNFTYNNLTEKDMILKNDCKNQKKIIIDNYPSENIINKFKSINPTVRNKILDGMKNILSKDNNIEKKAMVSKIKEKFEYSRRKNTKDKNYYATKIQKIFRGFIFRKKNEFNSENKNNAKCNQGVYIRKKVMNNRSSMNSYLNISENKNYRRTYLKERNRLKTSETKNFDNKTSVDNENKIEEIIIDKRRIYNALNPSSKNNNIQEITINNSSFRNMKTIIRYKLIKYFNIWKDITKRRIIILSLINYMKNQRRNIILNNIDYNYQRSKINKGFVAYRRSPIKTKY